MRVEIAHWPNPVLLRGTKPVEAVDALPPDQLTAFIAQLSALALRAAGRLVLSSQRRPVAEGPRPREIDLTQEEAAERFRLPLRTVRFLTRTGRVPSKTTP